MSYLTGQIVWDVNAGAPNNKGSDPNDATLALTKTTYVHGKTHTYASAQSLRLMIRNALTSLPSPTVREGTEKGAESKKNQKATTSGDPISFADDDLFGYMKAEKQGKESGTVVRDSPFMLGTAVSVAPVRPTVDWGVMKRGLDTAVIHRHEFYTADLAAPFLLDVPSVGTFTVSGSNAGRPNYLSLETARQIAQALSLGASEIRFRGKSALRLPISERRNRVSDLLRAMADMSGGAKKALHYGDRSPSIVVLLPMKGGLNPLGNLITHDRENNLVVDGTVLRQELTAYSDLVDGPVLVGWRPGYHDKARQSFENDIADLIESGDVRIGHPRTTLRDLASAIENGEHDSWFSEES